MPKRPSASRRWCKICKLWLADNRIQREQHEQGPKHKEALQALLSDIAARNDKKANAQRAAAGMKPHKPKSPCAQEDTTTARVAQQLFERAARGPQGSKGDAATEAGRPPTTLKEQYEWEQVTNGGWETVDSNGYPVPASAVYGKWETVEEEGAADGDAETEDGGEGGESAGLGDGGGLRKRVDDDEEDGIERADSRLVGQADVTVGDEAVEDIGGVFRKRKAPRCRRVRKRTRR